MTGSATLPEGDASADNAGNGTRGLRAAPSLELFKMLRECYGLSDVTGTRDLGGSSSLNLFVAADGSELVARVYRPYVSAARLDAIQTVRRALANGGVPCAELIPACDGATRTTFDGRLVELEPFVASDGKMDTRERLESGLPWLGRIHTILRAVRTSSEGRTPLFANHIEPFDALAGTLRGTERVRRWNPTPEEQGIAAAAERLARQVEELEQSVAGLFPRQLVHGDFWDNNVLFQNGWVVLVTDLDFMGERSRIDDLALTLYFTDAAFLRHLASRERAERLRPIVDLYEQELNEPLSRTERTALPLALARQPLWWIGRWLPMLDDDETAGSGFTSMAQEVERALQIILDVDVWQAAFI